jgi:Protein tyrosine phosphatase
MQPENKEKNRYSTALPFDTNRVLLEMMNSDESTSYINAAYVDSYKHRNTFILTQSPLPHTVDDFWRMLCEHGSTTLIMLNAIDEGHVRMSLLFEVFPSKLEMFHQFQIFFC